MKIIQIIIILFFSLTFESLSDTKPATIQFNGGKYTGELMRPCLLFCKRIPDGYGIYTNGNETYKGNWKANVTLRKSEKFGFGLYINPTFEISSYKGNFKNDKPSGQGEIKYRNGNLYTGKVTTAYKPHGNGTMNYTNGNVFSGEFKYGIINEGEMRFNDGRIFKGKFINNEPNLKYGEWVYNKAIANDETSPSDQPLNPTTVNINFFQHIEWGLIIIGIFCIIVFLILRENKNKKININNNEGKLNSRELITFSAGLLGSMFLAGEILTHIFSRLGSTIDTDAITDFLLLFSPIIIFIYYIAAKKKYSKYSINNQTFTTKASSRSDGKISGTGFFINDNGYFVTNSHVLNKNSIIRVKINNKTHIAKLVKADPVNDMSLLKLEISGNKYFQLANDDPERLDSIIAIGYGYGKKFNEDVKVTSGVVSSLTGISSNSSHIQIDAAIQSGNSGGPIINQEGNVVAIAVEKLDAVKMYSASGTLPENVNFAIKVSSLKQFLESKNVKFYNQDSAELSKKEVNSLIDSAILYISSNI